MELCGKMEQCVESMSNTFDRMQQVPMKYIILPSWYVHQLKMLDWKTRSQSINKDVFKHLEEISEYQLVFLNPKDRYKWKKWLKELQLPLTVTIYMYLHGNNLGTMNFAWKVSDEVDQTLDHQTIAQLNKSQKVYYTRQMRSEFLDTYTHLSWRVYTKS